MSKRLRTDSDSEEYHISSTNHPVTQNLQPPGKYAQLDPHSHSTASQTITCGLPPHEVVNFTTYGDYEIHYLKSHVNRCLACGKNFPSSHFLSLHITEHHDPLNSIKRDRGEKTYRCFVEDCKKVCSTPQKRRMHLVDKHMFPKNYDFYTVNHGSDNRTSLLKPEGRSRKAGGSQVTNAVRGQSPGQSTRTPLAMADDMVTEVTKAKAEGHASPTDTSMDEIAGSMAALRFVPKSVTFGRGRQRKGLSKD
ncbi:hypothetical protein D6C81_00398 [Aureobasidium pullulans]|nr:hypothetical protein D6C81_00398 [Aureobasidium pullulans]